MTAVAARTQNNRSRITNGTKLLPVFDAVIAHLCPCRLRPRSEGQ